MTHPASSLAFRNLNLTSFRSTRSRFFPHFLPHHNWPFYPFSRPASTMADIPRTVIKVQGPDQESKPDHEALLKNQLQSISPTVTNVLIDENTPSDAEWALLGAHLKNVEVLELESGFQERLNDKYLPLHWPLKKLTLSSPCGDLTRTPFIRQGWVSHLCLLLTCNLRFEGPTNEELNKMEEESSTSENTSMREGVNITYFPGVVASHMQKVYEDPNRKLDPENEPPAGPINMKTLEIWENDALDTLSRMCGALPHIVANLQTLLLRSTRGFDFALTTEETFRQVFPAMGNLEVLNFTVGEIFQGPELLPTMYQRLPPNLTTLYFRGPVSLITSGHWAEWLEAFRSPTFLPKLERLAFVLDFYYEPRVPGGWLRKQGPAPLELLQKARQECEALYGIARDRGIVVEDMPAEPRPDLFTCVDSRW